MKFGIALFLFLLSSPLIADVNLPKSKDFFKTEKLVKAFKTRGGEVRILSSAKDFTTLKMELEKLLGEGWQTEAPKEADEVNEAERKALGLSKDTFVIYMHPENPGVKVTLGLTKLPGIEEGESRVILTILKGPKG